MDPAFVLAVNAGSSSIRFAWKSTAGGIGENPPLVRERICNGLGFLGIALNQQRNEKNTPLISRHGSHVKVRVIRSDEEFMIARSVASVLHLGAHRKLKP